MYVVPHIKHSCHQITPCLMFSQHMCECVVCGGTQALREHTPDRRLKHRWRSVMSFTLSQGLVWHQLRVQCRCDGEMLFSSVFCFINPHIQTERDQHIIHVWRPSSRLTATLSECVILQTLRLYLHDCTEETRVAQITESPDRHDTSASCGADFRLLGCCPVFMSFFQPFRFSFALSTVSSGFSMILSFFLASYSLIVIIAICYKTMFLFSNIRS